MKPVLQKWTNYKILFYTTVIFIVSALITGFLLNYLLNNTNNGDWIAILGITLLAIVALYVSFAYIMIIYQQLHTIRKTNPNLISFYKTNKLFRTSVNKSASCVYLLLNAFICFASSFHTYQWYYLSVSGIFFLIFIMQLYLITNLGDNKEKQTLVISILTFCIAIALLVIVILLSYEKTAYASKGLMIYWDALYVFVSMTMAIIGVIHAIQRKDVKIGRFLTVKLVNAIFGMFTLTVTMLLTFSENWSKYKIMAIIIGYVAFTLIIVIVILQFFSYQKQKTKNSMVSF